LRDAEWSLFNPRTWYRERLHSVALNQEPEFEAWRPRVAGVCTWDPQQNHWTYQSGDHVPKAQRPPFATVVVEDASTEDTAPLAVSRGPLQVFGWDGELLGTVPVPQDLLLSSRDIRWAVEGQAVHIAARSQPRAAANPERDQDRDFSQCDLTMFSAPGGAAVASGRTWTIRLRDRPATSFAPAELAPEGLGPGTPLGAGIGVAYTWRGAEVSEGEVLYVQVLMVGWGNGDRTAVDAFVAYLTPTWDWRARRNPAEPLTPLDWCGRYVWSPDEKGAWRECALGREGWHLASLLGQGDREVRLEACGLGADGTLAYVKGDEVWIADLREQCIAHGVPAR